MEKFCLRLKFEIPIVHLQLVTLYMKFIRIYIQNDQIYINIHDWINVIYGYDINHVFAYILIKILNLIDNFDFLRILFCDNHELYYCKLSNMKLLMDNFLANIKYKTQAIKILDELTNNIFTSIYYFDKNPHDWLLEENEFLYIN